MWGNKVVGLLGGLDIGYVAMIKEREMTDVKVMAKSRCTYCGGYYEQMGMAISWTEKVGSRDETTTRLICHRCLIEAFDNALGRKP